MLFLPLNSCLEKLPEKEVSMMMDVPTDLVGLVKGKKSRNLIDLDQRFRVFSFFPSNVVQYGLLITRHPSYICSAAKIFFSSMFGTNDF
mmetsp:Transcript_24708/g.39680  ORF Transcript_24708/g.39680 Transcript_24708/m.39680 type:complete len:89 (-) Transcript_24708:881-1147(-)